MEKVYAVHFDGSLYKGLDYNKGLLKNRQGIYSREQDAKGVITRDTETLAEKIHYNNRTSDDLRWFELPEVYKEEKIEKQKRRFKIVEYIPKGTE